MIFEKISLHRRFIACIQNIHWKVYIKIMMYSSWDVRRNKGFLSFWAIFCPLTLPKFWKNEEKKNPKGIIILHLCTPNDNHMMYGWDMDHDRQTFLSFWTIFCPFTILTTWKIKFLKKWKKHLEIYHFTQVYHDNHMMYGSGDMKYNKIFCHFGPFLMPFYSIKNQQNLNFEKMKENVEISKFYTTVP